MKEQILLSYKNGITRTPSDFLCSDGDLSECINLEVKNEELVPMEMPVDMGITLSHNEELICIHAISQINRKNFITKTTEGNNSIIKAFYLDNSNKVYYDFSINVPSFTSCTSIGMTLLVFGENDTYYVLFKELNYKYLGSRLPDVSLSFNLTGEYKLEDEKYSINETGENTSVYSITDSTVIHQAHVNKFINENAINKDKFMYPFFIKYALKLFNNDTYTRYSAPILMLPSIYSSPSVHYLNQEIDNGKLKYADFIVGGYIAELQVRANVLDSLEEWKDIVKGVSVFITRQNYSYNQSYSDSSNFLKESNPTIGGYVESVTSDHIGELTNADILDGENMIANQLPTGYTKWNSKDVYSLFDSQCLSVPVLKKEEFIENLLASTAVYYKYADIDIETLKNIGNEYVLMSAICNPYNLNAIEQGEKLDTFGDYMTNDVLIPSFSCVYNSRLNIANVKRIYFNGYKPESLSQPLSGESTYDIYTYINDFSGNEIIVKSACVGQFELYGSYLYYPDTDAVKMVIVDKTANSHVTVPLTEDVYSNGAYALNLEGLQFVEGIPQIDVSLINYEYLSNKMFTSEVNNPFYFPLAGINTVGVGEILGISALTRPISQGQFGDYPLMAFCTDGNYALKVDEEGYYSGMSPMQEDIILGQEKLTPLENSILAITKKGIMMAGGSSDMVQIALQMDGKSFMTSSLNSLEVKAEQFANLINKADDIDGFRGYLEGARMAYDYSSNRIVIYNRSKSYGYVYGFANGIISKIVLNNGDNIITHVVSYPDSIIQTASGKLYSLYQKEDINTIDGKMIGFALTRPLKFGNPLGLKSIRQYKNMWAQSDVTSSVKSRIFGSNDNITYVPLQSKYGKPYKYYRIAFYTDMLPKESLSGTALVIDNRRTNKLR